MASAQSGDCVYLVDDEAQHTQLEEQLDVDADQADAHLAGPRHPGHPHLSRSLSRRQCMPHACFTCSETTICCLLGRESQSP